MSQSLRALRPHAWAIAILLGCCAFAIFFKLAALGLTLPNSDYQSYVETAELFAGQQVTAHPARILKPLAPAVVTALAPALGFQGAFLFETLVLYLAFALALYWLAWEFFTDTRLALFTALLGALSYPMMRYGVDLYTESGAQFFYISSLAFTLRYLKAPSRKLVMLAASVIGIGFLWKEYVLVAGIVFGLVLLFEQVQWRTKVGNLALLCLCALAPTLLVQVPVYLLYHYTYLDWYTGGGASGFTTQFTFYNIAKSFWALLGLAWFLVPFGALKFWTLSPVQKRFLYFGIPASLMCLGWGNVSSRLFYVAAPAFLLLAVLGLARLPRALQYALVAGVIVTNFAWLIFAF